MRTAVCAWCLMLALSGQEKPSELYASALTKYVGGDVDAAFDALARVPQAEIQMELAASIIPIRKDGAGPAVRRRLEAIAMLHTDYALLGGIDPKAVLFHVDMAHLALSVARLTVTGQIPDSTLADVVRAREFIPHWTALATSVLLNEATDRQAMPLVEEALKLLPENGELLFWRGAVLEFRAVWVGEPATDSRPAVPAMRETDGSGFDMVKNQRLWAPVEEAYRRALAHDADNAETHLHLGYALYSLRSYGPARAEYELARDRSTDPFVVYVADLLLARVKEDQNDVAGAAQDYEHAIAKMPDAQSAYVGLGMLEARRGNAQRARELTMTLAAVPEKRRVRDPWWAYHTARIPMDDLKWLRQAVRQ